MDAGSLKGAVHVPAALRETLLATAPILRRELRELLRSPRAFWMAVLTVAGSSLIPLLAWPEDGSPTALLNARAAFERYQWTFTGALFVFVPLVGAGAIAGERERGTYELLLGTMIPPAGIVLGKLVSSVAFFLLLLILTFPIAATLFLLGGFTAWDYGRVLLIQLGATFAFGLLGLTASVRHQRTAPAVLKAYLLSSGLMPIFLLGFNNSQILALILVLFLFSSVRAFRELVTKSALADVVLPIAAQEPAWMRYSRLRRPLPPYRHWLARQVLDSMGRAIPDSWNPVLVASIQCGGFGKETLKAIFTAFTVVLPTLLFIAVFVSAPHTAAVGMSLLIMVLALVVPALASNLMTAERDGGNLDHLRTTALSSQQILLGKLGGALLNALVLLPYGLVLCGLMLPLLLLLGGRGWTIPLAFLAAFDAVAMVASTSGILAATLSGTGLQALVLSYLFSGVWLLGPLLAEGLGGFGFLSPLTGFLSTSWRIAEGSRDLFLFPLLLAFLGSHLVAVLQFGLAVRIFEKKWMRDD
jgi:ABC-type transport system involved in multi-copper enzyme maturation permease subunit